MNTIIWIIRALGVVAAFLFLGSSLVIAFETLMRYVGHPTSWAQDFAIYFMIGGAFLCQGAVMLEDGHVRVDFFIDLMSVRLRWFLVRLTLAISLAYVGALGWWGGRMALRSFMTGKTSTGLFEIKMWIPEVSIPIGCFFLFIAMLIRIWKPKIATMHEELKEHLPV